jgi:Na+/melibiose symporter-like transporter
MCWLVAILCTVSAVCQFVDVFLIYNINKKTLDTMHAEIASRRENEQAESVVEA